MQIIISGVFLTDIITNSSSVVYSYANSKDSMFAMFNELLTVVSSDQKAEDLFEIAIVEKEILDYPEMTIEGNNLYEQCGITPSEWKTAKADLDYKGKRQLAMELLSNVELTVLEGLTVDDEDDGWGEHSTETVYIVRTKDGKASPIGKMVQGLFSHEGSYDG